jgi:23S rRNA (uridine2552-2'-O)-methyltransferase
MKLLLLTDPKLPVGKVIGIDKRGITPIDGVTFLFPYDFTQPDAQSKLTNALGKRKVDVVLSDMAPSSSGMKEMDHDSIVELSYHVLRYVGIQTFHKIIRYLISSRKK